MAEFYPDESKLENHLCTLINERAEWLQKMDQSLRDHGTQYGALLGAMENVRIQEKISCFHDRFGCIDYNFDICDHFFDGSDYNLGVGNS